MEGEAAHHLGRVLRAQPGQLYELSDGASVWLARVESVGRERIDFALIEPVPASKSSLEISLLLSVIKFDSFEWSLEKATELGVSRIVPLAAARSEKALLGATAKRSERWKRILLEASQQSRRLSVPSLEELTPIDDAFANASGIRILLSEKSEAASLRDVLNGRSGNLVSLAIGPEGGWTDSEFQAAHATGFVQASMGQLILRAETAVIAALANLNYALGAHQSVG